MKAATDPRILVVQTAFIGDVVLTTPLLRALRDLYPTGFLAFLGTPAGSAVLSGLPFIDQFLVFDKRGADRGLAGLFVKARELKAYNFDIAVSAHRSARTAFLLARAGIRRRIGFATSALPWLYHQTAPRHPDRHEVERNLALMEPLGKELQGFEPSLALPAPAGDNLLENDGQGPRVGICPGSVWQTKRYNARGFARVADELTQSSGASVYLIGAEADKEAAREVQAHSRLGVVNMAGKTSLRQWLELMGAMDLVITNDSSPTHVAGALGVPVAVIFGPTTPGQGFAPWNNRSRVVEIEGLSCRPCGEHGARRCPEGHFKCMETIMPEQVLDAALGLLSGA